MVRLSRKATEDLKGLLLESRERWGDVTAARTLERLERQFTAIAEGRAAGHRRQDVPAELPLRFVNEPPFVIAFDTHTRTIVRIVHGRRDVAALLVGTADERG